MGTATTSPAATNSDELRHGYDRATSGLDAPLAIVDLGAFDANVESLLRRSAGLPIRVASKSVRCRYLLERVLARDGMSGILSYSLAEALWLLEGGVSDDLLVGYPTADRGALRRLAVNERARSAVTLMIDSVEHLDWIEQAMGMSLGRGSAIRVCLELDVSWKPIPGLHVGPRRSPVFTPRQAAALAEAVVARKGFRLVGLMGYEGQIAGIGDVDANPLRSLAVKALQHWSADELNYRRASAVDAVRQVADLEFVNGGGTGSFETTVADRSVTELAAGSGLIGPTLFDSYSRFRPRPAALFALPVVRKPIPDVATLFSGGFIASGPIGASRLPSPHLPEGLKLLPMEGAGEVQTPVTGEPARQLKIGDRVWLRHAKAGELAERFDDYHLVVDDRVERTVPTYRGEGKNFG